VKRFSFDSQLLRAQMWRIILARDRMVAIITAAFGISVVLCVSATPAQAAGLFPCNIKAAGLNPQIVCCDVLCWNTAQSYATSPRKQFGCQFRLQHFFQSGLWCYTHIPDYGPRFPTYLGDGMGHL
jgi:hypothetical protein